MAEEANAGGSLNLASSHSEKTSLPAIDGSCQAKPQHNQHNSFTEQARLVLQACHDNNVDALIELAASKGGFVNDDVRKIAWPILIGSNLPSNIPSKQVPWQTLPQHYYEINNEQVAKDVARSFVYYPFPEHDRPKELECLRKELEDVIVEVLRRHPRLAYYQGFHEIAQVLFLVLGKELSPLALRRISLLRLRDHLLIDDQMGTIPHLRLLAPILFAADKEVFGLLPPNPHPNTGIQAVITLYAHDIHNYADIARLWDFLLASPAVMAVYFYAVIMLDRKEELLSLDPDYYGDDGIMSTIFQKYPQPKDMDRLIFAATQLYEQHPPERLPFHAWSKVSETSVLVTTIDVTTLTKQTLEEGEVWHEKDRKRLLRVKAFNGMVKIAKRHWWVYRRSLHKHRRPLMFTLAVAVGVVGLWLGRRRVIW
ncbi:hypothetical protein EJ08DRAFT_42816 [Tothia fuscella]|uniref:Rab-GAP TBC domain-containing protein n=1 Tax=Tothia fuscella TaxID=1048955 RepID=A0A9P4NFY6_9PEZI|nr:hypothetical protein EJ08DRAFT_42816 [Tothia fuscella]